MNLKNQRLKLSLQLKSMFAQLISKKFLKNRKNLKSNSNHYCSCHFIKEIKHEKDKLCQQEVTDHGVEYCRRTFSRLYKG